MREKGGSKIKEFIAIDKVRVLKTIRQWIHSLFYSRWKTPLKAHLMVGYSCLLPVPSDLPVFLEIALETLSSQDTRHMIEVFVIPDRPNPGFRAIYKSLCTRYPLPNIRLIEMCGIDRLFSRIVDNPNMNHFLQLINGIANSSSTHVLFHDADLFLMPGNSLRLHFEECCVRRLYALGIDSRSSLIDRDLVATWEMVARTEWLRSFKPTMLKAQIALVDGKWHGFDTTLLAQHLTNHEKIGCSLRNMQFFHINYLISLYRKYQKSPKPFEDTQFKLLTMRLIFDIFSTEKWQSDLPPMDSFIAALTGKDKFISYTKGETAKYYPRARSKIKSLSELWLLKPEQVSKIQREILPFDQWFEWRESYSQGYS